MTIKTGRVTRCDTTGVWVRVADLGGEVGPFPSLRGTFTKGTKVALARFTPTSDRWIVLGPTEGDGYALVGEGGAGGSVLDSWKGEWSAGVDYAAGDIVFHDYSSWLATEDPGVGVEPTVTGPWTILAQAGSDGMSYNTRVPEDFGAVGDDVTDDQDALQACFDSLVPGDTLLLVNSYAHSGVLTIDTSEITVTGGGTLKSTVPATSAIQVTGTGVTFDGITVAARNVTVRLGSTEDYQVYVTGDRFTARNCSFGGGPSASVLFSNAHYFHIQGCYIDGGLADGFHVTNGSSHGHFVDCVTTDTGDDGFAVVGYEGSGQPMAITIHDCRVEGSDARGIGLVGASDVTVTDCVISDTVAAGVMIACEPGYTTYAVSGLYLDRVRVYNANTGAPSPDHSAFFVYQGRESYTNDGITLHECEAWNTDAAASGIYRQVVDTDCNPATNFRIENCYANGTGSTTPWQSNAPDPDLLQITYLDVPPASGLGRILKPEAYGAAGDGVTDDQAALDAMFADTNNGDICVLAGTYAHTDTVIVTGDAVTITGGGTLHATVPASSALDIQSDDVVIDGITLSCASTTQLSTGAASLLLLNGCDRATVRNVTVWDSAAHGILADGATNVTIDRVTILDPLNIGIYLYGAAQGVLVRDTRVQGGGDKGVYVYGPGGGNAPYNVTLRNVTVDTCAWQGISLVGVAGGITLDGCVVTQAGGAGIHLETGGNGVGPVTVTRCVVRDSSSSVEHANYFLLSNSSMDDMDVTIADCESWDVDADCTAHYRGITENGGYVDSVRIVRCYANNSFGTVTATASGDIVTDALVVDIEFGVVGRWVRPFLLMGA